MLISCAMLTSCALSIEFHIILVIILMIIQVFYISIIFYNYFLYFLFIFHLLILFYLFLHVSFINIALCLFTCFMPAYSKEVNTGKNCMYSRVLSLYETVISICTLLYNPNGAAVMTQMGSMSSTQTRPL